MQPSTTHLDLDQATVIPAYRKLQRIILAICIFLAPITFTLYVVSWNDVHGDPIATSMTVGAVANQIHLVSGFAATFFLPLGYLGMALLGMRRAPWLATITVTLGVVGWLPWSALIGIDDLAYDIALRGSNSQLAALWTYFNSDPLMNAYLLVYAVGHLLSTILLGILLARTRLIPIWAAWALMVSSPLTIVAFVNAQHYRSIVTPLVCALLLLGCLPAALAMVKDKDEERGMGVGEKRSRGDRG